MDGNFLQLEVSQRLLTYAFDHPELVLLTYCI